MYAEPVTDTNNDRKLKLPLSAVSAAFATRKIAYRTSGDDEFARFHKWLAEWRRETAYASLARDKIDHPAFKKIVGIGRIAIPWILKEIRHNPDFLVLALPQIYKDENPVPVGAQGKVNEIVNAWLSRANRTHIDAD